MRALFGLKKDPSVVEHVTLDLKGPGGVARLHLIPPVVSKEPLPSMLVINGMYQIPLDPIQATLIKEFIRVLNKRWKYGQEISEKTVDKIMDELVAKTKKMYPAVPAEDLHSQFHQIMTVIFAFAKNEPLPEDLQIGTTMEDWRKIARGPRRMDIMTQPVKKNGHRSCPLNCGICYADSPTMDMVKQELMSTADWQKVIALLPTIGTSEVTFTGGEPGIDWEQIITLVESAGPFITRVNTSGVTLDLDIAKRLRGAFLDSIQFTFYSWVNATHDALVGRSAAWGQTVSGIRAAIKAGLDVSVNTPLLTKNAQEYQQTLQFLYGLGVRYVTVSGVIPFGNGTDASLYLSKTEMYDVLAKALETSRSLGIDLQFTSPGWLSSEQFQTLGINEPLCGACFTNMAIMPNGAVVPCQSWLKDKKGLGHILNTPWETIWNSSVCHDIRFEKALQNACAL